MARQTVLRKPRRAKGPRRLKDGSVPESTIQAQIMSWLESTDLLSWRQNAGKTFIHGRKVNLGPIGISDIVLVVPPTGRFLGLEVKSANGAIRPEQKAFKAKLEASGGRYEVVRTLTQAQNAVAEAMGEERLVWNQRQLFGSQGQLDPSPFGPN